MNYILASHGYYSKYTKESCQMITGATKNMYVVSFLEDMNADDVYAMYEAILQEHPDEDFTIVVDFIGGTPCNASIQLKEKYPNISIVSGLSLSLAISLSLGESIDCAIESAKGALSIVKLSKDEKVRAKKETEKTETPSNGIVSVRIDERLIHGQVATMWTNTVKATRIMVVDNGVVKNDVEKMALKTAVPSGVRLSILTTEGAARRINNGYYLGQRVFLLVKTPQTLRELINKGVKLNEVIVGNMSKTENRIQVKKSVSVSEEEIQDFRYLDNQGIKFIAQMVPGDDPINFLDLLN